MASTRTGSRGRRSYSWFAMHRRTTAAALAGVAAVSLLTAVSSDARTSRWRPRTTTTTVASSSTTAGATTTVPAAVPPPTTSGTPAATTDYQPSFPIRASFYYPWFAESWNQQGFSPFTNYTPSLGWYSSSDASTISKHIVAMQYGGQDAGIASWWGQGTKTDTRIPLLLDVASTTTFRWSLYYEQESMGDPSVAQIQSDLAYMKSKYVSSPAFLKVNGRPVLFVYADGADACGMADRWNQANADRAFYVVLKVFSGYRTCTAQPDSWHQYGAAAATDSQKGFAYGISPGFSKKGEAAPRLVRDAARWTTNVASMIASNAPWQLITTFNEWGEGTSIESAAEWSSASGYGTYLDTLHSALGTSSPTPTPITTTSTTAAPAATTTTVAAPPPVQPAGVCGNAGAPRARQKVVVFAFENRTFPQVGGSQFGSMPYLNGLAKQCSTFSDYTEPDVTQNSATQYISTVTGTTLNTVLNDCSPSATCNTLEDSVFRQARVAGLTAVNYVEGATKPCSSSGNAAKHVPAMYLWGADDRSFCTTQVRPYSEFDPNNLADFSFVTPTLCNDGHDCPNSTVDAWSAANIQPVLDSAAYKNGEVAVFVWYDEDHPVPNLQMGAHVTPGVRATSIGDGSILRAWQDLLGVPHLGRAISATDIRTMIGL